MTGDGFVINDDDVIDIVVQANDVVAVTVSDPNPWTVVTVSGPQGPMGPAGPSYEGVAWWFDNGPPATVVGSKPGDVYLNLEDGSIWKLGD